MTSKLVWKDKEFKEKLIADLVDNMETAGKFLEGEARRRLLALPELDVKLDESRRYVGGAGHRKYVSKLIASNVKVEKDQVVLEVGTQATPKSRHFGFYIEMGSAKIPATPWLRPAVFENKDKIVKLLSGK